ncbi:phosphotriesterase-related protein-like [Xenia sp. Carnegie-2017]|uniref:phosphotriesterase-related protein-like n=1 Tax=Xenia sp. Carnegie-2017 TaxID=2897299 RepID=UPI001F0339A9|nr:phosphotriesterase-related protein-like [Xenia sp. Carnegie-2017]
MVKDKIDTVLGPVAANALQKTLTHEHLAMDFTNHFVQTTNTHWQMENCSFTMENLNWIRNHPYSHRKNLVLSSTTNAVVEDVALFKKAGGSTIVENSSLGLGRNVQKMKFISEETGVNIICGTGFYVEKQLTDEMKELTIERMSEIIVTEIDEGIFNTGVKPGIIGEVGCSWPLTDVEKRSIRAAAISQAQTHTPVMIHPGRNPQSPGEILRIFQESGGDSTRTTMAHLDRTFLEESDLLEFAKEGTYLEYDLFGIEVSYYQFAPDIDMPSDAQKMSKLCCLISEG